MILNNHRIALGTATGSNIFYPFSLPFCRLFFNFLFFTFFLLLSPVRSACFCFIRFWYFYLNERTILISGRIFIRFHEASFGTVEIGRRNSLCFAFVIDKTIVNRNLYCLYREFPVALFVTSFLPSFISAPVFATIFFLNIRACYDIR